MKPEKHDVREELQARGFDPDHFTERERLLLYDLSKARVKTTRGAKRLIAGLAVGVVLLWVLFAVRDFDNRQTLHDEAVAECVRSTEDRATLAAVIRLSAQAREARGGDGNGAERQEKLIAQLAGGFERRSGIDAPLTQVSDTDKVLASTRRARVQFCEEQNPSPSIWPWGG
jgi:hypothetical protein